ncbi:MAG TPA: alpha/beta fold hydrolase [Acidimicrobiales bacterium]|nr:alpha/beta fold hydrolase [Acidimicrobiales bacterium]
MALGAHLSRPPAVSKGQPVPGLVLCHGFPAGPGGAASSGQTYPELGDRLSSESGWAVLTFNFRGTGASKGQFSLSGWLEDLQSAVDHLLGQDDVSGVWLAGSSTGGALSICAAAEDERVHGVAALAAPADFSDWASEPAGSLAYAREVGVISDPAFPADVEAWARELREIRPVNVIGKIPPRPILLLHGSDDETVPVGDAHALAGAAGGSAELHVLNQAGHRLRHDPRVIAVLLGWMERQRTCV